MAFIFSGPLNNPNFYDSLIFPHPDCNSSAFNFRGAVTEDQAPPTNFESKNAFVSCLVGDTVIANTILSNGLQVITGAINIGIGLAFVPLKPNDVSSHDIVHKSLLFVSPMEGLDGGSIITFSGQTFIEGPTPAFSTDDAVVCWDGTSGRLVKNSTTLCTDLISGPTPATSTDDAVVCWNGTSGRIFKDSTAICSNLAIGPSPATSTDNAVALWDGTSGKLIKDSTLIGNSPTVAGLTLAGAFEVPDSIGTLTLTGASMLTAITSNRFPFFFSGKNFIARFGGIVYLTYNTRIAIAIPSPFPATPIAILPFSFLPSGVGIQIGITVGTPAPSSFVLNPGLNAGFAAAGDTVSPGTLFVSYMAGQVPIPAFSTLLNVEGIYWQA